MNNLDDRGGRWYNGLPSELMNIIYDNLVARYGSINELNQHCDWQVFSLYLARICHTIEKEKK
jgi:hypothetical protein